MNGFIRRYLSPAEPGAPTSPASPPATPPASPPATPPATPPASPDFFIKADGSYVDKFWEHPAFPAELKDNMQIRTHKGVADTYKNWASMHKSQGLERILIPAKDAKPEVWDETVWFRLGKPKDAAGYTVPDFAATGLDARYKAPEDQQAKFLSLVHKANLTDGQFQVLSQGLNDMLKEQVAAFEQQAAAAAEAELKPVKTRLGANYEKVRTELETFLRSTVKPDRLDRVMSLLDDAGGFEWLEKIAPAFAEAQEDLAAMNTPANTLAEYEAEVGKLTASKAYLNEFDAEHAATVARVNDLRKILAAVKAKK